MLLPVLHLNQSISHRWFNQICFTNFLRTIESHYLQKFNTHSLVSVSYFSRLGAFLFFVIIKVDLKFYFGRNFIKVHVLHFLTESTK